MRARIYILRTLFSGIVFMLSSAYAFSEIPPIGIENDDSVQTHKVNVRIRTAEQCPAIREPFLPDTTDYSRYPYIRFIGANDSIPAILDEEFFDISAKVVFPVSKWGLPRRDTIVNQLQNEVLPMVNRDSLELAGMVLRGAASPEGPVRFNKFLGEHRAQTLMQFLDANTNFPIGEQPIDLNIDIEDYRSLCIMMRRANDKDYELVQMLCDQYLPDNRIYELKKQLRSAKHGTLWRRLLREYYPSLRSARMVLFFRNPRLYSPTWTAPMPALPSLRLSPAAPSLLQPRRVPMYVPRRELLSVKTNLLLDFAYVPGGYDRWCPIPNVAVEYYPLNGHFTYGFSFDCPWWQHWEKHKYFQIRNYQFETRYYLRPGDIALNPPGEGAAFRGLYLQGYAHLGLFGICFDADRGWVGEGLGAGVGIGYVKPISRDGHWRLEFALQAGFFTCKYDPYQYESPFDEDPRDDLYYYKYYGDPDLFKKRQHHFTWFGPTRVGITLSYDLLYRRITKKGAGTRSWEIIE